MRMAISHKIGGVPYCYIILKQRGVNACVLIDTFFVYMHNFC